MYNPKEIPDSACLFDPKVDIRPVDPHGYIDVNKMVANGVIDGDILIDDSRFNGVADPSAMLPRPKDAFERKRQFAVVRESLRVAKVNAEASHSTEQAK